MQCKEALKVLTSLRRLHSVFFFSNASHDSYPLHPLSLLVAMSGYTTPALRQLSDSTQNTYVSDVSRVKLGILVRLLLTNLSCLTPCRVT
jgi:uncharacterized membrane protein